MVATPAKTSVAETRKHPEVNSRENLKSKSHLIFIGDDYMVKVYFSRPVFTLLYFYGELALLSQVRLG